MAASYITDDVNHVTKEVFDSIHDAAAPATIDSSTSALLHPKEYYSMRTVHFTLAFTNLGFAGSQILARVALVDGVSQYMFSIYRNLIAFVLIGPLAYYVERANRPQLTFSLLCKFNLLALTGIVGSQQLFLAGLSLTSPLFTAVCQNLIPIFTFLLAVSFGLEEVRILRRDGIAKVLGTLICIGGAITVSLYKGIVIIQTSKLHSINCLQLEADQYTQPFRNLATIYGLSGPLVEYKINNYYLGIICLLFNTFSWAVFLTLQMPILQKYPAPMTVNAFTYMFGFIQVGLLGAVWEGNLKFLDFNLSSSGQVIAILYSVSIDANNSLKLIKKLL
jgi:drug/metabolite transporter (DMT)-like permease